MKAKDVLPTSPGYDSDTGVCDAPALVGLLVEVVPDPDPTPALQKLTLGPGAMLQVAMSYPAGVDVAFVRQETASHTRKQYNNKYQVLMRLSWPHPKCLTLI